MKNTKLQTVLSILTMLSAGAVVISGAVLVQKLTDSTEQIEVSDWDMEEGAMEYNEAPGVLVVDMAALAPVDDLDAYIASMEGNEDAYGTLNHEYISYDPYTTTVPYEYVSEPSYDDGSDMDVPMYTMVTTVSDEDTTSVPTEDTSFATTSEPEEIIEVTTTQTASTTQTTVTEKTAISELVISAITQADTTRAVVTTTSQSYYGTSGQRTVPTHDTQVSTYASTYDTTRANDVVVTSTTTSAQTTTENTSVLVIAYTTTQGQITTQAPVTYNTTAKTAATTTSKTTTTTAAATTAHTTKAPFLNVGGGVWQSDLNIYNKMLKLLNAARAEKGLDPLTYSLGIQNVCKVRCEELSSYYSHQRPDGTKFSTAFKEQSIDYSTCGENIAYGRNMFDTVEEVFQAWMDSPSHYENIMCERYTHVAFGLCILKVNGDTYYYWAQEFAGFKS